MKQSPFYLNVPQAETLEFVFADKASNPNNEFHVTLKRLTRIDVASYLEAAERYIEKYITGLGEKGRADYEPPKPLPPVNGVPVSVTPVTCRVLSCIEYAQVQADEDKYNFTELAAIATVPKMGEQMMAAMAQIQPFDEADSPLETSDEATPTSSSESSEATQT